MDWQPNVKIEMEFKADNPIFFFLIRCKPLLLNFFRPSRRRANPAGLQCATGTLHPMMVPPTFCTRSQDLHDTCGVHQKWILRLQSHLSPTVKAIHSSVKKLYTPSDRGVRAGEKKFFARSTYIHIPHNAEVRTSTLHKTGVTFT